MKRYVMFLGICWFVLSLFVYNAMAGEVTKRIQDTGILRVGTTGHYPPFTVKDSKGQFMGFDIDLANILAQQLGAKLELKQMTLNELFSALQNGSIDLALAGITITPKRNLKVAFLGPYYVTGQSILGKKEIVTQIKAPEDMNRPDFTLVVAKNTTGEQIAKALVPKAHIIQANNMEDALKMVLSGKAQALFADEPFCVVAAFRNQDKDLAVSEPFTFEPLGVAIPETDLLWMNWLDNCLMKLNAIGELKRLKQYWFHSPEWMNKLPQKGQFM
ncbi:MAG: transporter substrate-binding domain-containing protein [Thermodesulfobacteria bacterium]|nr:transporter substrate-binding domain-containing protein [Thermodesulfobacteriota bacterium]